MKTMSIAYKGACGPFLIKSVGFVKKGGRHDRDGKLHTHMTKLEKVQKSAFPFCFFGDDVDNGDCVT